MVVNFGEHIGKDLNSLGENGENSDTWYLNKFILNPEKKFNETLKEYVQMVVDAQKLPEKRHIAKTVKS